MYYKCTGISYICIDDRWFLTQSDSLRYPNKVTDAIANVKENPVEMITISMEQL